MKEKVRVYKDGRAKFSKLFGQDFAGEKEVLRNYLTATIVKEHASPEDIAHSLTLVIEDLYLRQGRRVEVKIVPADEPTSRESKE